MENSALFEKLVYEECEGGITLIDFKEEYRNEVEELVIPDSWGVVKIANEDKNSFKFPFQGCKSLRRVVLPATLQVIDGAFCECKSLEEVVFPEKMERLGNWNFRECPRLERVTLPHGLVRIGYGNFEYSEKCGERDEEGDCVYFGEYLIGCDSYDDGTLTVRDGTVLIADSACEDLYFTEVVFPGSLKYIGAKAFRGCDDLEAPTLPDSVVFIGEEAFCSENGDPFSSLFVTDAHLDESGKLVFEKELAFVPEAEITAVAERLGGYLLKLEYERSSSYDSSDDDRGEDSESSESCVDYRELNPLENAKSLLRIDGEIRGVLFRVKPRLDSELELYPFTFDGKMGGMTLGYSASHSSNFVTVHSITLAKRGEDGAPEKGGYISFSQSESSPWI